MVSAGAEDGLQHASSFYRLQVQQNSIHMMVDLRSYAKIYIYIYMHILSRVNPNIVLCCTTFLQRHLDFIVIDGVL